MLPHGAERDTVEPARRRLRGRISIAVLDQALYAAANVAITLVAARSLDARGFGAFGVAYVVYTLTIGALRSVVAEPALVRSQLPDERARWHDDMLASGVVVALGLSALTGLVGAVLTGVAGGPLLALAVGLPGILVQDLGRYAAFADRRPERALRLDLIWIGAQAIALAALLSTGGAGPASLLLVWGGAGTVAAATVLRRIDPSILGVQWLRRSWTFSWRYGAVFATTAGITYLTTLLLGGLRGVQAVGAVRGAQVLFGPLNVAYVGVLASLVPEEAVAAPGSHAMLRRRLVMTSGALVAVALLLLGVCLAVPERWAEMALGDTWEGARRIVVPVAIAAVMGSVVAGANLGLRSMRAVHRDLRVNLGLAPVHLAAPVAGAVLWGVDGYAWGLAGASAVAAVVWWTAFETTRDGRA